MSDSGGEWAGQARETKWGRGWVDTTTRGSKMPRLWMDPAATKGMSELAMTKATVGRSPHEGKESDQSGGADDDEWDGNLRNETQGWDRRRSGNSDLTATLTIPLGTTKWEASDIPSLEAHRPSRAGGGGFDVGEAGAGNDVRRFERRGRHHPTTVEVKAAS
jgi:hypothetical protein